MPTHRHFEVARHILTVLAREGSLTPDVIRGRWTATAGPGPQPEAAFYSEVVRMLRDPGGYVRADNEGRLELSADGEMVAAGGEFIPGR